MINWIYRLAERAWEGEGTGMWIWREEKEFVLVGDDGDEMHRGTLAGCREHAAKVLQGVQS